jgi:WD40 repeat protein
MGFDHGDTSLYIWGLDPLRRRKEQTNGEILKLETRTSDHEGGLTATDFHPILRLYVTAGLDKALRIWNEKMELLKEVRFPQPIVGARFMNPQGDIIVGHETRTSVLEFSGLKLHLVDREKYPLNPAQVSYFYKKVSSCRGKVFWRLKTSLNNPSSPSPTKPPESQRKITALVLSESSSSENEDDKVNMNRI